MCRMFSHILTLKEYSTYRKITSIPSIVGGTVVIDVLSAVCKNNDKGKIND